MYITPKRISKIALSLLTILYSLATSFAHTIEVIIAKQRQTTNKQKERVSHVSLHNPYSFTHLYNLKSIIHIFVHPLEL